MHFWISTGSVQNWEKAIAENIWGVVEGLKSQWEKLERGDILFFYATSPVSGVIGLGRIESKFKQDKPLWDKEVKENKIIWPYRYDFKVEYVLPRSDWETRQTKIDGININVRSGLNSIRDKEAAKLLLQRIDEKWYTEMQKLLEEKIEIKIPVTKKISSHDEIKEKIYELGKIERFISEKEYVIPDTNERLDVVWRRVAASVPTFVFEIQIGGNLHQALAKLKHAFDIWNSNIFLITGQDDLNKANQLLGGSFHEIKDRIKVLPINKVQRVYELQVEDNKLKKEIGLR
jgi:hypothetical protein